MTKHRLFAFAAAMALVAVACGGGEDSSSPGTTPATAAPPTSSTDAPATPSTTVAVIEEPGEEVQLPAELAAITGPWETDWSRRTIDLNELKVGIPAFDPRDRIRPIDNPKYETIDSAGDWLVDREIGISVALDDVTRFYPLRILTAHEVVNDGTTSRPYVVTYCPLCNTAVAFDATIDGEVFRFGVSGLLRNSDLVMWDVPTESLWQQITGEGIVGEHAGTQLELLASALVRWGDFKSEHPDGEVLSQDTGFPFNYGANGYVGYSDRSGPYSQFFSAELDDRFPALERVVGVRVEDVAKAYPFSVIDDERVVNDELNGQSITVWWAATDAADNFDGARPGDGEAIGTGIAFLREVDAQVLTFAPLTADTFTDDETGSTWNLFGRATAGPMEGTQLELALHQNEFWFAWAAFNEGAAVHGL